jgi:hypothetical protein
MTAASSAIDISVVRRGRNMAKDASLRSWRVFYAPGLGNIL